MFFYNIKKFPSKSLYNVQIYKNGLDFGKLNFNVNVCQKYAVLNSIEILNQKDKGVGNGSYFLKQYESYVKNMYYVNESSLVAWQPTGCTNVVNFFKKHGYLERDPLSKKETYDDGVMTYDLYKMYKKM